MGLLWQPLRLSMRGGTCMGTTKILQENKMITNWVYSCKRPERSPDDY